MDDKRFLGDTDRLSIIGMISIVLGSAVIWTAVVYVFIKGLIAILL